VKKLLGYFPNAAVSVWPVVPDGPSITLTVWDADITWVQTKNLPLYLHY
jgi:hypothetical protein